MLLSVRGFWADSNERRIIMVYSNRECARRFVSGECSGSRGSPIRSANMRFTEDAIRVFHTDGRGAETFAGLLSYRTPIAIRIDDDTIAVNPNKYSISSSAHRSAVEWELIEAGWEKEIWTWRSPQTVGWHDPKKEWAFEKWVRKPLPELTVERVEELEARKEELFERWGRESTHAIASAAQIDRVLSYEIKDRGWY